MKSIVNFCLVVILIAVTYQTRIYPIVCLTYIKASIPNSRLPSSYLTLLATHIVHLNGQSGDSKCHRELQVASAPR
jgi:hypothetical protein